MDFFLLFCEEIITSLLLFVFFFCRVKSPMSVSIQLDISRSPINGKLESGGWFIATRVCSGHLSVGKEMQQPLLSTPHRTQQRWRFDTDKQPSAVCIMWPLCVCPVLQHWVYLYTVPHASEKECIIHDAVCAKYTPVLEVTWRGCTTPFLYVRDIKCWCSITQVCDEEKCSKHLFFEHYDVKLYWRSSIKQKVKGQRLHQHGKVWEGNFPRTQTDSMPRKRKCVTFRRAGQSPQMFCSGKAISIWWSQSRRMCAGHRRGWTEMWRWECSKDHQ